LEGPRWTVLSILRECSTTCATRADDRSSRVQHSNSETYLALCIRSQRDFFATRLGGYHGYSNPSMIRS